MNDKAIDDWLGTRMKEAPYVRFLLLIIIFGCSSCSMVMVAAAKAKAVDVGVILDMETSAGKMALRCISMALSDHNPKAISLHVRDSKGTVIGASAAALDLLKNVEVQAIIGPSTSLQADFVINLGENAQVPIVSFSVTSPFLSSPQSDYFVRATLSDSTQVEAIASLIRTFGWREVIPIYVDNAFGVGIIPSLANALQHVDVRVSHRSSIHPLASDDEILVELYKLMTMQTRVFVVHMLHTLALRVFNKAKEIGMMREGYVWITTNGITNMLSILDPPNSVEIDSMHGVLGIKPHIPRTIQLKDFISRWKNESQLKHNLDNRDLNIYGLWAYDAATALAIAVQKVVENNKTFESTRINTSRNSRSTQTDLETIGVSQMGKYINQELSRTMFRGLGGDFHIINGELQSTTFQIVNLIDDLGEKDIGSWTPTNGISQNLKDYKHLVNHNSNHKGVIWPGESWSIPKGWVIPTNGKQLIIGVPVKVEKSDFLNVLKESDTNETKVTGFCIDVFDAVMAKLPYHVPYKYVPFVRPDGEPMGDYNDLVYQVYRGNYDAVVGDVTIVANRSLFVDFTLPFMDSGVTMFVPYKDRKNSNPLAFLKPLTWDLWVTSGCFFVFIGFVIWILEHKSDDDFGSSQPNQGCTSFWSSFSAYREQVISNLARLVVIIWGFLVLILTQSYTATLTTLMTVQQLVPAITDVQDLILGGQNVGYPKGSFVKSYLKHMGFKDSQLKMFNSMKDLDYALMNKSIVAAFDESPYLNQLIGRHCSKYTMVAPNLKTGGFGFGFPRGSPLVSDVSRAILNAYEGHEIKRIENAWFGNKMICPQQGPSSNLSLGNFWALFLIVGAASSFAVIIFLAMLLYEHRHFLRNRGIESWLKIVEILREHNE